MGEEIWQTEKPVYDSGVDGLSVEATPGAFMVENQYSEFTCADTGRCKAAVYSQRIWDEEATTGYRIEKMNERAFSFIGWYYTYAESCPARLLEDEEGTTETTETTEEQPAAQVSTDTRLSANGG